MELKFDFYLARLLGLVGLFLRFNEDLKSCIGFLSGIEGLAQRLTLRLTEGLAFIDCGPTFSLRHENFCWSDELLRLVVVDLRRCYIDFIKKCWIKKLKFAAFLLLRRDESEFVFYS